MTLIKKKRYLNCLEQKNNNYKLALSVLSFLLVFFSSFFYLNVCVLWTENEPCHFMKELKDHMRERGCSDKCSGYEKGMIQDELLERNDTRLSHEKERNDTRLSSVS